MDTNPVIPVMNVATRTEMGGQLNLKFVRAPIRDHDSRLDMILSYLAGKGWVKRAVIARHFGLPDRTLRSLKQAARGQIISNSEQGYKLAAEATREELWHAREEAGSRVRELKAYMIGIDRMIHKLWPDEPRETNQ